ncbi:arginine--tRNA ligase [Mucisphaera calidilacus]
MVTLNQSLTEALGRAAGAALGAEHAGVDPILKPARDPKHGDVQANLAMGLGKKLGRPPREVAERIVGALDHAGFADGVAVAGPGFINITLKPAFVAGLLAEQRRDERLGVTPLPADPVVVDYSAPNAAKEMHVGHLRSSVIGDALARMLSFAGREVIRQNHLGDWGTQFGMLIEHLLDVEAEHGGGTSSDVAELNVFYKAAKAKFDADKAFAERSRRRVVALQSGDAVTLERWQQLIEVSRTYFAAVYERLGVLLTDADIRGESFYNDRLAGTLERFASAGQLAESQGATVIYPEGFADRDGNPMPMIVRKSDGGYLYATTDLAAALFRIEELRVAQSVYVTDSRQSPHFAMFFQALRQAGFVPEGVRLDHVPFGTVLGPDRKPFKSRSGDTIKLIDLIDEAESRAGAAVAAKNPDLTEAERAAVAHAVGVGALKYADLSNDRIKDYVFDWERMLALEGNTAPYLIYSYVRIRSIFRKGELKPEAYGATSVSLDDPDEKGLALHLLRFGETFDGALDALEPHRLCTYLYELAAKFHRFFEHCPVLKAEAGVRASRLALCAETARTLRAGLGLLGIETVEKM